MTLVVSGSLAWSVPAVLAAIGAGGSAAIVEVAVLVVVGAVDLVDADAGNLDGAGLDATDLDFDAVGVDFGSGISSGAVIATVG